MNNKIFFAAFALGSMGLAMSSCNPIEDRDSLSNAFSADAIEVAASQDVDGGNKITLKMNTPGVQGYWDYKLGNAFTDEVTFVCPFKGDLEFTFHSTTPYIVNGKYTTDNLPSKSINVKVSQLNNRLDEEYYLLTGEDLGGKEWVFDHSIVNLSGEEMWWYMANSDGKEKWEDCWWNAAGTCCPPSDQYGKLRFDLNGGLMVYHYNDAADAEPNATAKFAFSDKNSKIQIPPSVMLGTNDGSACVDGGYYEFVKLTANQMILYTNTTEGRGTGWVWVLKPLVK